MADLNKELNEYLLSNKNEKQHIVSIPSVRLPLLNVGKWFGRNTDETKEETEPIQGTKRECCPTLTRTQRLVMFVFFFFMGLLCFSLSCMFIPLLLTKARKFALLYTLGNSFLLLSFCFLWGPMNYLKSMFTFDRSFFPLSYVTILIATLYFALCLQSTVLTIFCTGIQLLSLISFTILRCPSGGLSLKIFTKMFKSSVNSSLPI